MGMFSFVSKWNKAGELFRTRQFILTFAKEEDLIKIEEVIKKRREELAKKEPNQQSPYSIIFVARSFMGCGCLLEMGGSNDYSLERITARERLPGTHANVGIRNLHNCFADFYFHVLYIINILS